MVSRTLFILFYFISLKLGPCTTVITIGGMIDQEKRNFLFIFSFARKD